jgi:LuxR family transcriptional regulator, maltose regulon positive regulatory protein
MWKRGGVGMPAGRSPRRGNPGVWVYPPPAPDEIVPLVLPRPGDRMSSIRESTRRQHYQPPRRLSGPAAPEPQGRPINVTPDGPAVLPPAHQADVAVLALHRLERDRLVISRPALFQRLSRAARVTQLSAPAGSGKTHLLRSWIGEMGLAQSAAWVSVEREERDAQRFWRSLLDALRQTAAGASVLREICGMPDLDLCALVEDLASLEQPVWLVIDGLQELRSDGALRQLEWFLLRAPDRLRVVLSSRGELRLGLHRLRLEGALTEIRSGDLPFTQDEARALLASAGVELTELALAALLKRTGGWAAGLRLAALSLAADPDPERLAVEFSGSERTVADYLSAEVLDRQPADARRLLLRTSVLDRVNGPLAERLSGEPGAERILHELEESGAFVVALDAGRSWFRYHPLFAELLQLELRRSEPDAPAGLHRTAAQWLAEHGFPVDAVRHAQAAGDWNLAAGILSDHWFGLELGGQAAPAHEILAAFPPAAVADDAELAALTAADQLRRGALQEAERYYALARHALASVSPERRRRLTPLRVRLRLLVARTGGEFSAAIEEAQRLLASAESSGDVLSLDPERRALTLITLGSAELRAGEVQDAERHLDEGILLARSMRRPYLEIFGLGWSAQLAGLRSTTLAVERATRASELAREHGWSEEPIVAPAYAALAAAMVWQGRLGEAQSVLGHADRAVGSVGPAAGLFHYARGLLELARGRHQAAVEAFGAAGLLDASLVTPLASCTGGFLLQALVAMGDLGGAEQALAGLDEPERGAAEARIALAALRLAQDDPDAVSAALAPLLEDGFAPVASTPLRAVPAYLLQALAHDALGDAGEAERILERALDLAEPDGLLLPFLLHPAATQLLKRHSRYRTTHASLISDALALLAGSRPAARVAERHPLPDPLSESETRVLRYLPTNLSKREIAGELCVSVHTVKTHIHHLYTKLDVHCRREAVTQARTLGLLAPSACG